MKKLKIYLDTSVVSHLDAPDATEKMQDTLVLWDDASSKGVGSSGRVFINPNTDLSGTPVADIQDHMYIALGHELIHAQRAMKGVYLRFNLLTSYKVDWKTYIATTENLIATGIWDVNENSPTWQKVTENSLRKENNLGARKTY